MTDPMSDLLPEPGHPDHELAKSELQKLLAERVEARKAEIEAERRLLESNPIDNWVEAERQKTVDMQRRRREHEKLLQNWARRAPNPAESQASLTAWNAQRRRNVDEPAEQARQLRAEERVARAMGATGKARRLGSQAERLERMVENNAPGYTTAPSVCSSDDRRAFYRAQLEATPPGFYDEVVAAALGVEAGDLNVENRAIGYSEASGEITTFGGRKISVTSPRPELRDTFVDRATGLGFEFM